MHLIAQPIQRRQRQPVDDVTGPDVVVITTVPRRARREPLEPVAEVQQDVGRLAEDEAVGRPEGGRRAHGRAAGVARVRRVDEREHGARRAGARRVGVGGAGLLEGEADVLAAAGQAGPVDELVGRGGGGHDRGVVGVTLCVCVCVCSERMRFHKDG